MVQGASATAHPGPSQDALQVQQVTFEGSQREKQLCVT
jgi:hypothetical protein